MSGFRRVIVTLVYETTEQRAEMLRRVTEALNAHEDAAYEIIETRVTTEQIDPLEDTL